MAANKKKGTIRIQMTGSVIGCPQDQRATVRGLGLRRRHQIVERVDTPMVRGMVRKINHLVAIVDEAERSAIHSRKVNGGSDGA